MNSALRPSALSLLVGDIIVFAIGLWLALFLRSFSAPSHELLLAHLTAFAPLFVVWVIVFVIAGLYEGRRIIFARRSLSATLLYAQTFNILIAALAFFFIPSFGISPKTILLIYLVISFLLIVLWRVFLFPKLGLQKPERAVVIGDSEEIRELTSALHSSPLSPLIVAEVISPAASALSHATRNAIAGHNPRFIIADFNDARVAGAFPELYNLLAEGIRFIDAETLYEDVFGRIPLSSVDDKWVARNISRYAHTLYDPLKRLMDMIVGLVIGIISLLVYPFVALAIKIEDGGPVFIKQERVGEEGHTVRIYKFRSMRRNNTALSQDLVENPITRVGRIIRTTRIDELPQLWNVVAGDLSLIGPRPELPAGVALYEKEIPYYGLRHLIKPGLSGWAQLYHDNHPHHGTDVEATREKLSYDLYYLKHRSIALDALIVLKTIEKMLTKSGV
ncbi:exopolysaccharide biosynthesis polyprenyl glycosylphosphotransferase [bacterium]|nr:MAG: exopolysaccharide biosynthesis polyprenyl glycosylphosphotransferase [bacterium]